MVRGKPAFQATKTRRDAVPAAVWRYAFARAVAIVLCCVWITGCVPAFLSKKANTQRDSESGGKVELIKPRIAGGSAEDDSDSSGAPESATGTSGTDSKRLEPGESKEVAGRPWERPESLEKSAGQEKQASREVVQDIGSSAKLTRNKEDTGDASAGKIDPAAEEESSDTRSERLEVGADAPLRKHDHSRYVNLIKNKAIDQVNKDRDADFVQLCHNTTTDQWSLTVYYRLDRTYSFTDYAWDEIGLKWEKVFSSRNKPAKGWNWHLDFTSAGKECQVLKGSRKKW